MADGKNTPVEANEKKAQEGKAKEEKKNAHKTNEDKTNKDKANERTLDDGSEKADDEKKKDDKKTPTTTTASSISVGAAINAEYKQKYGFDGSAATRITARMVTAPPPTVLLQAMGVSDEMIKAIIARWPGPSGGPIAAAQLTKTEVSDVDVSAKDTAERAGAARKEAAEAAHKAHQAALKAAKAGSALTSQNKPLPPPPEPNFPKPEEAPTLEQVKNTPGCSI